MDNITPEMLHLAMMYLKSRGNTIKRIKVKSTFAAYLEETCHPIFFDENIYDKEGIIARFTGIPIVVDDEIEAEYYEIEYVKESTK